jgi:hypothetical protein
VCCEENRQSGSLLAISIVSFLPASIGLHRAFECLDDRQAGDGYPLASRRFSLVLAMEVAASQRQAKGAA